jgi:hypothetical protein
LRGAHFGELFFRQQSSADQNIGGVHVCDVGRNVMRRWESAQVGNGLSDRVCPDRLRASDGAVAHYSKNSAAAS